MASIQKRSRKDGTDTFRVGYVHDPGDGKGRRLMWTHPVRTADAAVEIRDMFDDLGPELALATLKARTGNVKKRLTLEDWFEKHMDALRAHCTPGTIAAYQSDARLSWMPRLGPLPLEAITREHVTSWVAWQREQETVRSQRARRRAREAGEPEPEPVLVAPKTIKNYHGVLSSVLGAAVEAGHLTKNVARSVKLPDDVADAQREKDIFTEREWETFYDHVHEHYRPLTLYLVATGCRIGEASALQVRDINLYGPEVDGVQLVAVDIRRAWKKSDRPSVRYLGGPKSRRGNRTLLLAPGMRDVLAPLMEGKGATDLVFTSVRGARVVPNNFSRRYWHPAMRKAGIDKPLTPHSLRHTSASWLLMSGVAPQVVQHRLGHESLATTSKVYAHLLVDAQASAVAVTARALGLGGAQSAAELPQIEA